MNMNSCDTRCFWIFNFLITIFLIFLPRFVNFSSRFCSRLDQFAVFNTWPAQYCVAYLVRQAVCTWLWFYFKFFSPFYISICTVCLVLNFHIFQVRKLCSDSVIFVVRFWCAFMCSAAVKICVSTNTRRLQ